MRYLFFLMGLCFCFTQVHATNPDGGLYSKAEVEKALQQISKKNLDKVFKEEGLESVNMLFYKVIIDFVHKARKIKSSGSQQKLTFTHDKRLLAIIVNRAQYFTDSIDPLLMHFYGLSKLYEALPQDFEYAIDHSAQGASDRKHMREALKSQIWENRLKP